EGAAAVRTAAAAELRVRGRDAVRVAPRAGALDAEAAPANPEAVLQSEPPDPGAEHPGAPEHDERGARSAPRGDATADGSAVLRADSQPRHRDDPARDRGEEPEDAARVGIEPPGVQRTPRPRPRKRRRLQAGGTRRTRVPRPAAAPETAVSAAKSLLPADTAGVGAAVDARPCHGGRRRATGWTDAATAGIGSAG